MPDASWLNELEPENTRPNRLLAAQVWENVVIKEAFERLTTSRNSLDASQVGLGQPGTLRRMAL